MIKLASQNKQGSNEHDIISLIRDYKNEFNYIRDLDDKLGTKSEKIPNLLEMTARKFEEGFASIIDDIYGNVARYSPSNIEKYLPQELSSIERKTGTELQYFFEAVDYFINQSKNYKDKQNSFVAIH